MRKLYKNFAFTLFLLFTVVNSYGQLPNFSLSVTSINETCLGNGTLNFQVTGTDPAANITYTIYLLPNITNPYRTLSTNSLTGLNAGNYRVVAKQTLGNLSNSQQQDVTIQGLYAPLDFTIVQDVQSACNGTISIEVTSGNAISYEIFAGPVTRPEQSSPVFTNLPSGNYIIRVHDSCNEALSRSYTYIRPIFSPTGITILPTEFPSILLPACNQIIVGHHLQIAPQYYIAYPLTFTYTVRPPGGGAPTTVTTTVSGTSGIYAGGIIPEGGTFSASIPYYPTSYTYDLVITDACGNAYRRNNNVVNKQIIADISANVVRCGMNQLKIGVDYFMFPISVQFTSAPAGFNPSAFNANHPNFIDYPEYGSGDNPVPEGTYVVRITDACGRSSTDQTIVINSVEGAASGENTCPNGPKITATSSGSDIVSIWIRVAPPGFAYPLPYNAQAYITESGAAVINGILIPGNYVIDFTDECNNDFTENVTVPNPSASGTVSVSYLGDCSSGMGSIYIRNSAVNLVSVILETGPSNYPPGFPHNISTNIRGTNLLMNGLPIGVYTATVTDLCGSRLVTLNVQEYIGTTNVNITERCSSFDMYLSHSNNNSLPNLGYWLQKRNEATGTWEHPVTNVAYIENTFPSTLNSIQLNNNALNINLGINARYRIMTVSSIFATPGNGSYCYRVLREFDTGSNPVINDALSFSCSGTGSDVLIDVIGTGPFNYKILEKDYQPFNFNNFANPLFTNLQPGVYLFQVEDTCGNQSTITHDVSAPFVFNIAPQLCNGSNSTLSVPDLPYLQYKWFKQGQESTILSTSATLNFTPLNLTTHSGIYFVQIIYPSNTNSCLNQTLSFNLNPGALPSAGNDKETVLCSIPFSINLFDYLSGNFDLNGTWEQVTPGGTLSANVWDLTGVSNGIYQFKYIVNGFCGITDEAIIKIQFAATPPAPILTAVTPLCVGEPVNIAITNVNLLYTYSWTGPNGFTANTHNPVFPNASLAMAGTYTVTAYIGINSCGSPAASVTLAVKPIPEFHFENQNVSICENQEVTLAVIGDNFDENLASFVWYFEGDEIPGINISEIEVDQPGLYKAIATYDGCKSEREFTVGLSTNVFEVGTKVGCENDLYLLSAFALNNSFNETTATYEWSGPNGFTSDQQSVDVTGLDSGDYIVVVTNEEGCKSEGRIFVKKAYCKIPKGVSPNDDFSNDTWYLVGMDIQKVKIFNRYGTEVYEQNNYSDQWYGQSKNGNLLPTATYYYYIKFNSGQEKTGWVYLNREIK